MAKSAEQIMSLWRQRKTAQGPVISRMEEVRRHYDGDVVVPLPELDRAERPAVANLLAQGLDQSAMRMASVMPDVVYPADRPGFKNSEETARVKRNANLAWWYHNKMRTKMRRRARHLVGYGSSPVIIRPDMEREMPMWHVRNPLTTFPAPGADPDDITPLDCIFSFVRSAQWLKATYPNETSVLRGLRDADHDDVFDVLEYVDDREHVLVAVGKEREPYDDGRDAFHDSCELMRMENRAGVSPVVIPGRITLNRDQGQFDGILGMYQMQARLMALSVIATEKGIFPERYLISRQGELASFVTGPFDGRTGKISIVKGGDIKDVQLNPGFMTNPTQDRLERAERLTGGIPSEFGGECVDMETEILTAEGWRRYDEVAVGTEALTLNHRTGMAEWQPIQRLNIFSGQYRVLKADGPRHSSVTTLNHRWPVESLWNRERKWITSAELTSAYRIPIAAMNAELPVEPKWSDALVEAVAWFYTEGSVRASGSQISQSIKNPENCDRIRACLTALFGPATTGWRHLSGCGQGGVGHDGVPRWSEPAPSKQNGVIKFLLSRHATDALTICAPGKVPSHSWLRTLTQAQLELFLRISMLADNCGESRFGQKDPARTEAFAFAAILSGQAVSYQERHRTDWRPGWPDHSAAHIVRLRRRRWVNPKESAQRGSATFVQVDHDGIVWCPTTENTSWYARRQGAVYFTGNSTSNVRTGRRGDAVLSAVVDFPVQEGQEALAAALEEENRRAVAFDKAYFNKPKSFYVNMGKTKGKVDYTPGVHFTNDTNFVSYSFGGADINNLIIGLGQRLGIGSMSLRTAQEIDPFVDDPELEHDRTVAEALERSLLTSIEQMAAAGAITPVDLARIMELVRTNKKDLAAAVEQVQREAQERQAAIGPPGTPAGPAEPGSPEAQIGLQAGPEGAASPAIQEATPSTQNLSQLLSNLRRPQITVGGA